MINASTKINTSLKYAEITMFNLISHYNELNYNDMRGIVSSNIYDPICNRLFYEEGYKFMMETTQ